MVVWLHKEGKEGRGRWAMADFYSYQNKKGDWCARKRLPSGDRHFNSKTTDRRTYEKRAREWYASLVAEQFGEAPKLSFLDAVDKFCVGYLPAKRAKTAERYSGVLLKNCPDNWADRKINTFTPVDMAEYESARRAKVKPQTIGFEFKVLSSFFEYLERFGLNEGNPVRSYLKKLDKKADVKRRLKRKRYLLHDEENNILRIAPAVWRWRIVFAIETGLRKEEQFSLERRDVCLKTNFVTVRAEIAKNGKERKVPISDRARKAIKEMADLASIWVCPKSDGSRVAQDSAFVNETLQEIALAVGIPATKMHRDGSMTVDLTWHDLRRTCGVRLLRDRRMSMEEVQRWLGHDDIRVTQESYAFLAEEDLQERLAETEQRARAKRVRGVNGGARQAEPYQLSYTNQEVAEDDN